MHVLLARRGHDLRVCPDFGEQLIERLLKPCLLVRCQDPHVADCLGPADRSDNVFLNHAAVKAQGIIEPLEPLVSGSGKASTPECHIESSFNCPGPEPECQN